MRSHIHSISNSHQQKSKKRQVNTFPPEAIVISGVVFQYSFNYERKKKISCGQSTRIDQHLWLFGLRRFGPFQQEAHRREPSKSQSENLQMQSLVSMDWDLSYIDSFLFCLTASFTKNVGWKPTFVHVAVLLMQMFLSTRVNPKVFSLFSLFPMPPCCVWVHIDRHSKSKEAKAIKSNWPSTSW